MHTSKYFLLCKCGKKVLGKYKKKTLGTVKWILRYLKGSSDVFLTFQQSEDISVLGYVDSNYAGGLDRKMSTIGYIIYSCRQCHQLEIDFAIDCRFVYNMGRIYGSNEGRERSYPVERFGGRIEFGAAAINSKM